MAKQSIKFPSILTPAPDPVSPDGSLMVQAGTMDGQAAGIRATGDAVVTKQMGAAIEGGGNMALDAYKGKLLSDQEAAIRSEVAKREAAIGPQFQEAVAGLAGCSEHCYT